MAEIIKNAVDNAVDTAIRAVRRSRTRFVARSGNSAHPLGFDVVAKLHDEPVMPAAVKAADPERDRHPTSIDEVIADTKIPQPQIMKSRRRKPIVTDDDEVAIALQDLDDALEAAPDKAVIVDPVAVAARLMLMGGLKMIGSDPEEVGVDGSVCVVISPPDWSAHIQKAWKEHVRHGQEGGSGRHDYREAQWSSWLHDEDPKKYNGDGAAARFAETVSRGRHCAGFAPDAKWLPKDMNLAADFTVALLPLRAADVVTLGLELCGGEVSQQLTNEQAAVLTPRLLRLARRPGQSADAYITKLLGLLQSDADAGTVTIVAPVSTVKAPRDEPDLSRLHGMDEAVEWGLGVAKDLKLLAAGLISWGDVDKGCLLSGPPGCGKTLFARALAQSCDVELFTGTYGGWLGTGHGHQGDLLKGIKNTFAAARSAAPSIIFIDEIDSFPNRGTIKHAHADWEIQVVNALLAEIDGVSGRDGVIVIGACNHPHLLDPALVRSGRLDRQVKISLPDAYALSRIFREHLGKDLEGVALDGSALLAVGSSGADCEKLVRGARRRARSAARNMVIDDLLEEIGGADVRTDAEIRLAAVHEAGHAVAILDLLRSAKLEAVSIRSSGGTGGFTASSGGQSPYMLAADMRKQIIKYLSGRAAEEIILGQPSSGCGGAADSDLAAATVLAVQSIRDVGLDDEMGLFWTGAPLANDLAEMLAADPRLGQRVNVILTDAYQDSLALIRRRLNAVEGLAKALIEHKALDGAMAEAIIKRHDVRISPMPFDQQAIRLTGGATRAPA